MLVVCCGGGLWVVRGVTSLGRFCLPTQRLGKLGVGWHKAYSTHYDTSHRRVAEQCEGLQRAALVTQEKLGMRLGASTRVAVLRFHWFNH